MKIDKKYAAVVLIEILYEKGLVNKETYMNVQTATFCGQQGRISRPVRAILNGQF